LSRSGAIIALWLRRRQRGHHRRCQYSRRVRVRGRFSARPRPQTFWPSRGRLGVGWTGIPGQMDVQHRQFRSPPPRRPSGPARRQTDASTAPPPPLSPADPAITASTGLPRPQMPRRRQAPTLVRPPFPPLRAYESNDSPASLYSRLYIPCTHDLPGPCGCRQTISSGAIASPALASLLRDVVQSEARRCPRDALARDISFGRHEFLPCIVPFPLSPFDGSPKLLQLCTPLGWPYTAPPYRHIDR